MGFLDKIRKKSSVFYAVCTKKIDKIRGICLLTNFSPSAIMIPRRTVRSTDNFISKEGGICND